MLLQEAGVPQGKVQIVGSADWNNDSTIANTPYLRRRALPRRPTTPGFKTLNRRLPGDVRRPPHALRTLAYTAVILANASSLSTRHAATTAAQLTLPGGFNGRDGVFRFLRDGRSEYAW